MHNKHTKITKHFFFFLHTGDFEKPNIVVNSEWISPVIKRKNKKEREKGREEGNKER